MDNYLVDKFIKTLSFFNEFSDSERMVLVKTPGVFEKFKTDEVIIAEGDTDPSVYVILKGTVKITKKPAIHLRENHISLHDPKDIIIAELKAGSIFGEISLISKNPRKNTVRTSSGEAVLMKITDQVIQKFSSGIQKKFHSQLINILIQRLNEMNEKYIKLKKICQKIK